MSLSGASTSPDGVEGWYEAIGVPASVEQAILQELSALDVRLRGRARADPPRTGVVMFGATTTAVADVIREVTTATPARVLAISVGDSRQGDDGWDLLRAGASDVIPWRDPSESARHVASRLRRWQTIDELVGSRHVQDFLVGASAAWQAILRDAVEVARFTDASVLVTGASGTGKERVAQLIHELDPRPNKGRLVVLDCSTIVPSLSGSEFFGHEKGAFTGASTARDGAFELANGGTLFLDEVGELTVALQAELLRVIQEGTFKRVGSNLWRKSSFRLVCATNRDVEAEQANGSFRNDFYYRIAGCRLRLPSLRERTDDIIPLFRHFFRQVHPDREPPEIEPGVRDLLLSRPYPGNVRDLRSLVLRVAHRYVGDGVITIGDIPDHERPTGGSGVVARHTDFDEVIRCRVADGASLDDIRAAATDSAIRVAVDEEQGSLHRAAMRLGVPVVELQDWDHAHRRSGGVHGSS